MPSRSVSEAGNHVGYHRGMPCGQFESARKTCFRSVAAVRCANSFIYIFCDATLTRMKTQREDMRGALESSERIHHPQHACHWGVAPPKTPASHLPQMRTLTRAQHELRRERAKVEFLRTELRKHEERLLQLKVGREVEEEANQQHTRGCRCESMLSTPIQSTNINQHSVVHTGTPERSASQFTEAISAPSTSRPSDNQSNDFSFDPINATDPTSAPFSSPAEEQVSRQSSASLLSGSMFVAIVVLVALPAAIVIGVFFLRKKRRRG